MKHSFSIPFIAITTLTIVLMPSISFADFYEAKDQVSTIVSSFQNSVHTWEPILKKYTTNLFMFFMILDVAFLGIKASQESGSKHDIFRQFIMVLLFGGFILAVINNHQEWSWQIINGLQDISRELSPTSVRSDKPFELGLKLCWKVLGKISAWSPIDSLGYIFTGLVILVCFALLSAQVIYIKCSSIVSLLASMILLGFGGSSFTKDYALNAIRFVFAIAFRLFVIQLLLGIGASFIDSFTVSEDPKYEELFTIIGASVVLLTLVCRLPDEAASILNGSQISSGMALVQTAGAVGSMVAGVGAVAAGMGGAAISGGKALSAASDLAKAEGKSGLGKAAHMGQALWESHKQASADLPGQSSLKRMTSNMRAQLEARKEEQRLRDIDGGNA